MRLKFTVNAENSTRDSRSLYSNQYCHIPLNHTYLFSSAIYKILRFGSQEFSTFLHNIGYELNGKKYKLFTFAVRFKEFTIQSDQIILLSPTVELYVASALTDDFFKSLIVGSFSNESIKIASNENIINFKINEIESLPEIEIKPTMKFKLLSPMVCSTIVDYNGKLSKYYLRQNETEAIDRILSKNLKNKYKIINRMDANCDDIHLEWDENYLRRKRRITKKITIKESSSEPIEVIGLQAPFTITGDPELIKIGYECGFGEENSLGFGMAEAI